MVLYFLNMLYFVLIWFISAAFLGFDNHRKSVLFGAALLYDETSATFDWLFTTFLKCMSNKKLKPYTQTRLVRC
jgi:hypothetical protein